MYDMCFFSFVCSFHLLSLVCVCVSGLPLKQEQRKYNLGKIEGWTGLELVVLDLHLSLTLDLDIGCLKVGT